MSPLRVTIRGDGSSDDALKPLVEWVLREHLPVMVGAAVQLVERYDPLPAERKGLTGSIERSLRLAPCELLVAHRDSENDTRGKRVSEIDEAVAELRGEGAAIPPYVCLVPIRMTEAWLLFDEPAIRAASGNPNGKVRLKPPAPRTVEGLADPKSLLRALVKTASELTGRRLKKLETNHIPRTVAAYIDDFAPLRQLSAFRDFEAEVRAFAESWGPAD